MIEIDQQYDSHGHLKVRECPHQRYFNHYFHLKVIKFASLLPCLQLISMVRLSNAYTPI